MQNPAQDTPAMVIGIEDHKNYQRVVSVREWIDDELATAQAEERFLIDPLGIYCQHTGRQFARLDDDMLNLILGTLSNDSIDFGEELWDELETRALVSARPSPAWMSQTLESYKVLCKLDPIGAIVKYTGFAFIQNWSHRRKRGSNNKIGFYEKQWISLDDRIAWQRNLVTLFDSVERSQSFVKFDYLDTLFILLQADAKIGLHNIAPPKVDFPIVDSWDAIASYYRDYTEEYLLKKAKASRSAADGSGFSWSLSEDIRINHRPSKTALLKLEKEKKTKAFDSIWAEVMHSADIPITKDTTPEELTAALPKVIKVPIANKHTKFNF